MFDLDILQLLQKYLLPALLCYYMYYKFKGVKFYMLSCGTIIDSKGKILIGHMTNQKYWDFPKGKMEDGETEMAAAIRDKRRIKHRFGS